MWIAYLPIHLFRCVDGRQVGVYSTKALDGIELVQCRVFWTKKALLTTNRYRKPGLLWTVGLLWTPFQQRRMTAGRDGILPPSWETTSQLGGKIPSMPAVMRRCWKGVQSSPTVQSSPGLRYSLANDFSTSWSHFTGAFRDVSRYGATVSASVSWMKGSGFKPHARNFSQLR